MPTEDNKRIAKNTLFLYMRMLLIMAVNLYTIRIVLKVIGIEDYGIYNVVGGIVTMFSFITGTMVSASQRFFSFELGRKNYVKLNQYFNVSIYCYIIIAFTILFFAETVGLWFLKTQMLIPPLRANAAGWVYQFSITSLIITMMVIPYDSIIISREKMNIYAFVSIAEAILKLGIVYLLILFDFDKLKLYAILTCSVTFFIPMFYVIYCNKKFNECKLTFFWNQAMFKELMKFSGWSLFGGLASVFRNQGINILLNIFFGPVINAARGIASQVSNTINQFLMSFYKAVQPQITKTYAAKEHQNMMLLVFRSSRFSYYLLFFLSLPILIEMPFILKLWLHEIPAFTVLFTRLMLITILIESISYPLMTSIQATGRIKWYQIVVGGLLIINLPISYVFLKFGYQPEITMYISIILAVLAQGFRLIFMQRLLKMSIRTYLINVIMIISAVSLLSSILPIILHFIYNECFLRFCGVTFCSFICCFIFIYIIGLQKEEKKYVNTFIRKRILRINRV